MLTDYRATAARALVLCGALSSAFYVFIDVFGALHYPHYNYSAQAISEMSAIGSPTAQLLAPFYRVWSVLFVAFTMGALLSSDARPALRWSAAFLLAVAMVGTSFSAFPMNERGADRTMSDTMHLIVAAATMLLLSGAILAGRSAFGTRFRRYSVATVVVMLLFFALTLRDVPNVAAHLPTPFMGLNERISMTAWLLWIAVLSVRLLRSSATSNFIAAPGAS